MYYINARSFFACLTAATLAVSSLAFGQTTPQFSNANSLQAGIGPTTLIHADLDGNGTIDFASADRAGGIVAQGGLSVFLVDKGGFINEPILINFPEGHSYPRSVVAIDLDNDQDIDLATANWSSDSVTVFVNDGSANFSTYSISELNVNPNRLPTAINASDVDNDGLNDLIVASGNWNSGALAIYRNNGNHNFTLDSSYAIPFEPRDIAVGDLNGDEDVDIGVACRASDQIELRFNNGQGAFNDSVTIDVGYRPRALTFADFDDDGDLDISVAMFMDPTMPGEAWIIENLPKNRFQVAQIINVGVAPHTVAVADVDADCDLDFIIGHVGTTTLQLMLNDQGSLHFTSIGITMPGVAAGVVFADIDDDQRPDIIAGAPTAAGQSTGLVFIRHNQTLPCEACSTSTDFDDCNNNDIPDFCDISESQSQDCNQNGIPDTCDISNDPSLDINENGIIDDCDSTVCIADLNTSGLIDINDFVLLLIDWGCQGTCIADLNNDQVVGIDDFSLFLFAFGTSCP